MQFKTILILCNTFNFFSLRCNFWLSTFSSRVFWRARFSSSSRDRVDKFRVCFFRSSKFFIFRGPDSASDSSDSSPSVWRNEPSVRFFFAAEQNRIYVIVPSGVGVEPAVAPSPCSVSESLTVLAILKSSASLFRQSLFRKIFFRKLSHFVQQRFTALRPTGISPSVGGTSRSPKHLP